MARRHRLNLAGQTYHITQHGIDERPIFRCDEDRQDFLRFLGIELVRSGWTCLAYCLMKTHYHVVLRQREETLSSGFQRLNGLYAQLFNRRHGRRGHLFEARFGDKLVDSEAYYCEVLRYVHLNPVRVHHDLRPEEYQWSDYGSAIGLFPPDPIVDAKAALEPFGRDLRTARQNYRAYVEESDVRVRRGQTRARPWGSKPPRAAAVFNGAMRLNAWLARAGVASRRGADELIKAGRVTVNGAPGQLNTFVEARDVVRLDGRPLAKQRLAYVLLHKPAGVVTTARDPQGRPTVVGLVGHEARIVPVGRLDADTTGALLLTNDGELAHRLAHPRYGVDKVYVAETWKQPSDADLDRLRAGVELDDGRTAPARVRRLDGARIEVTIHEGRNRQVKRMFEAVGHRVRRLHRSRFGPLTVDGLQPGQWRELEPAEVERLRNAKG